MNMDIFEIYIACVSWGSNGQKRPAVVLSRDTDTAMLFNITTCCADKGDSAKNKCFQIVEWQQAGLDRESCIDTFNTVTLPISSVDTEHQIGKLTNYDTQRLIEFLLKQ